MLFTTWVLKLLYNNLSRRRRMYCVRCLRSNDCSSNALMNLNNSTVITKIKHYFTCIFRSFFEVIATYFCNVLLCLVSILNRLFHNDYISTQLKAITITLAVFISISVSIFTIIRCNINNKCLIFIQHNLIMCIIIFFK